VDAKVFRRTRISVLAVVAVVIAGALIAPAPAHVTNKFGHLFNKHIKRKLASPGVINAARNPVHWTKLKGVPASIADGGLQRDGEFRISTNDWRVVDEADPASTYVQPGTGLVMRLLSEANAATAVAVAYPEIPTSMFGETLDLIGMELCYDNAGSTLQLFGLRSWVFSAGDPESSSGTSAIATQNAPAQPTGAACERLDLPGPYTLTAADRVAAVVQATLPNQNASNLELYRLSIILRATP